MKIMFYSSSPARVCLYGEHQDYLNLRVIPAAINLRLNIFSELSYQENILVESRDLERKTSISNTLTRLESKKGSFESYLEAGMLALKNNFPDLTIPALKITIESKIPIASGLSSSAALLVAWVKNLGGLLKLNLSKTQVSELAYDAEHNILGVPCGKMDQYACSFGDIISLSGSNPPEVVELNKPNIDLIVVDSQTPKLTSDVHGNKVNRIKRVIANFEKITQLKLTELSLDILKNNQSRLKNADFKILNGVLSIKEYTEEAESELLKNQMNLEILGELLTKQHISLRDNILVSLPILDKIVNESLTFGALGAKLTGAGLGGSVVIMTKDNTKNVAKKLEQKLKLPVKIVEIDKGVSFQEKN